MFRLNQRVSSKDQEIFKQRRDTFLKKLLLNDFRNIGKCNVSFQRLR